MQQAARLDGLGFDLLSSFEDGFGHAAVDVDGGEVTQALVVAVVIVVLDEGRHGFLERPGQVVVLEQDAVLEGLVPAFDLALGLWMPGSATDVTCTTHGAIEPFIDCQNSAPDRPADRASEPKAISRQFFACTRAEPMRSSQTWAAR